MYATSETSATPETEVTEPMNPKIGICEWSLPIGGPYACKLVAELGLGAIHLDIGPFDRGFSKSRPVVQEAWLEMGQRHGVVFTAMAVQVSDHYNLFAGPGSEEPEIVRRGIRAAIDACTAMKIPVTMIGTFLASAIRNSSDIATLVETFQWACDLAGERGVTIAAENPLSVEATLDLFDRVDRSNLKLYFDSQNYHVHSGAHTPEVLEALYPHVVEVHLKDGVGDAISAALLGSGDVDVFGTLAVLKARGYHGWLMLENHYDQAPLGVDADPVTLIRRDIDTVRRALR
jgi:sugar phosphate isomerase/epimerase